MKPLVAVIMGSDSDLPVMQGAVDMLDEMGIAHEVRVVSAHRTPEKMQSFAQKAASRGLKVIIAGAGGAAHLPGMVAACTTLPVIGVPVKAAKMDGLDALLSIAQMPKGIPVATMAVDNSANAGLYAARILALNNKSILKRIQAFGRQQKAKVALANKRLKAKRRSVRGR
ncbi:MAG: 5-(carboxyamino)imidazole ribonucleotide mutase [Elusimicrobia bacterium]|nr:MAG: 5-(carboxyamino)imidazole ribonucleotide mutase [Elusimicrobiota bacterium]